MFSIKIIDLSQILKLNNKWIIFKLINSWLLKNLEVKKMKDSINDQGLLDSARAKHIQKGSHVVRYENVERNINDIIYGDSKIFLKAP